MYLLSYSFECILPLSFECVNAFFYIQMYTFLIKYAILILQGGVPMTVSENIRFFRKKVGYTQKQLSELAGIATITLQQYELEKREPKLENLQKIATALGVPLAALLDIEETDQALNVLSDFKNVEVKQSKYPDMFNLSELKQYFSLNKKGKNKALSYIEDLAKLPEYTKTDN